jgi:hypothetical protein
VKNLPVIPPGVYRLRRDASLWQVIGVAKDADAATAWRVVYHPLDKPSSLVYTRLSTFTGEFIAVSPVQSAAV